MFTQLNTYDIEITKFITQLIPHNYIFDKFFSFFSFSTSSLPIWFVIIIFLILFEEKINKKFIIYIIISLAITSAIVFGLKHSIVRSRPYQITTSFKCPTDFSFPSGHAATAFASATVLAFFDKKRKWFYYIVAILIALSRIYLNCHYFLDVIMGGVIGFTISKLTLSTKKLFNKKSLF